MIEFQNVTKKFGSLLAVDNLSLTVRKGEIYGFIGPNGAGKTTTIKMAAGLLKPTGGSITIGGFHIMQEPEKAKAIMGYVPDDPYVYERLTGIEFLHLMGELWQMPKQVRKERIAKLKTLYPIGEILNGYMENYSRGNKQKTVILAALLHAPKVLFIDEPIVGLDPESVVITKKILMDFSHKNGGTVFVSSHTLSVLEEICDRVGIIRQGKLLASGTLEELHVKAGEEARTLEEMYLRLTA